MSANGTFGHSSSYSDSDSDSTRLGPQGWIDRTEYIRLLVQSLNDLGYPRIATQLETAAQLKHEDQSVVELRYAVQRGNWDRALELLDAVPLEEERRRKEAKFLILEEKFLEAVDKRDYKAALIFLRSDLGRLGVSTDRLHLLATCLLCPTSEDLKKVSGWQGKCEDSRQHVLGRLQEILPPHVMLPRQRLVGLVEQALKAQRDNCLYHNSETDSASLFLDYESTVDAIPSEVVHELIDHTDEVWHVEFSNDGKSLASCAQNGVTIVWEFKDRETVVKKHELRSHTVAVMYLAWSPDDRHLATISQDGALEIWDPVEGKLELKIDNEQGTMTAVGWMPDSKHLVSGSNGQNMHLWDITGRQLRSWSASRIQDLAVSRDGKLLIAAESDKKMKVYDMDSTECVGTIVTEMNVSAITLSRNGRYLLASTQNRQVQLWTINGDPRRPQATKPKTVYKLPDLDSDQQKYIIRTCFGGYNESFVVSGSEECKVYIWHRKTAKLIISLEGHSGLVNAVCWNPTDPSMFASASDDTSVQIWGPKRQTDCL